MHKHEVHLLSATYEDEVVDSGRKSYMQACNET